MDDWLSYLIAERDIGGIATLVSMSKDRRWFGPAFSITRFVGRLAASGETALARLAGTRLASALASIGDPIAAADVYEMWARSLTKLDDLAGAIDVCDECWAKDWRSRNLANRYSLALERNRRWLEAVAICDDGLRLAPGDDQLSRRRERCLKRYRGSQPIPD